MPHDGATAGPGASGASNKAFELTKPAQAMELRSSTQCSADLEWRMKALAASGLIAAVCLVTVSQGCKASQRPAPALRFDVPKGWTELSKDTPGLPEMMRNGVLTGRYWLLAGDLNDPGAGATMIVALRDRPFLATPAWLRDYRVTLPQEYARRSPGRAARVLEADIVTVASVRAGRLLMELADGRETWNQLSFVMPVSGERLAMVGYTARSEAFPRYRQMFEDSAQATVGLAEPSPGRRLLFRAGELVGLRWWQ
jgi:hypothetical protein